MGVTRGFGGFPAGAGALPARPVDRRRGADSYGRGRVRPLTPVSPCVRTRRGSRPADVGLCSCGASATSSEHCGGASACAGETGESSAKSGGGAGAKGVLGPRRHGSPAREQQPCSGPLHQGVD
ncbi:hypothetical protein COCCADRAFT_36469 [Bipolaris zeicola 26-R-13]|uniref:Uncharacterized protein n=1 Tax=Cochliobolus carbonum (strain 26-R-13) TaxID=930089 RepID=W6YDX9_COCC2|nr:uncharacterized protein COCCADRAFT_36469 [Bipolaris zeicola 26-R-13]EUC33714.1 hypothetical protein COCCADRAFT_36469 [Bipolaris zeicola 26-R-13]